MPKFHLQLKSFFIFFFILTSFLISGCAGHKELIAPCDFDLSNVENKYSTNVTFTTSSSPCRETTPINI